MATILLDGWQGSHHRLEHLRRVLDGVIWPYENSGRTSIVRLATELASHLRCLDRPFHAVGYSMGGLVIREALRQQPDLPLRRAVFLHTPHQGTLAAHLLPGAALREMRPDSDFLRCLNAAPWTVPTLNVWCPGDLVVIPGWNARWPQAAQEFPTRLPAHVWPLFDPALPLRIAKFLTEQDAQDQTHPDPAGATQAAGSGTAAAC